MAIAGRTGFWNGPQLAARWLADHAPLPRPRSYAVYRETTGPDGRAVETYRTADEADPLAHYDFEQWRLRHQLAGPDGLALAVLVIREVVDAGGTIRECVIERRRGTFDGPFYGNPARVEFVGSARAVRLYTADAQGRLVEATPTTPSGPTGRDIAEGFGAEEDAIRARFGPEAVVLDRRSPTLFEDMIGLSSVVHVRGVDGDIGCGIGWHGPMVYLLIGAFPRLDHGLALPPADESAVALALHRHGLVRHEMRLDPEGLCVMAGQRNGRQLFILRAGADRVRVERYTPGDETIGSADQRRWISYAEAHEGRIMLDAYQDGASDELVVLTGDAEGQVWRHRIDPDGVELACGPANETAVAALYRGAASVDEPATAVAGSAGATASDLPPDADSLLAKARAFARASAVLRDAMAPDLSWEATAACLRALVEPLDVLRTHGATVALTSLLRRGDLIPLSKADRTHALAALERQLLDELAEIRIAATVPPLIGSAGALADPALLDHFPEAAYHADEARRCLALRRPAAAAYHVMLVVRVGLRAIDEQAERAAMTHWSDLMAAIGRHDHLPAAIHETLRRLRRAWHAPTLLPAEKYTEEEAASLLAAADAFMRAIAGMPPPTA
jgi:hypothetical protein